MAWAAARVADGEGAPTFARARELVLRWMQWSAVVLLCDRHDRQAELDLPLEEAMRGAMTRPMGFEGWRTVFEALVRGPRTESVIGVPGDREYPADHAVASAIWAATGEFDVPLDVVHLVRAVADPDNFREDAAPAIVAAARSLIAASPLGNFDLVRVERMEGQPGGRFRVDFRAFAGTAWPSPRVVERSGPPPLRQGQLAFWDGEERQVAVPEWLLRVDPKSMELLLYDGREAESRAWRFQSARPGAAVTLLTRLGAEAPVILAEPTWRTPAPASRRATPAPATLRAAAAPVATTYAAATAPAAPVREATSEGGHGPARFLLTVLSGRSYLRFCALSDDDSVVMGRNPAFATFVIHNGEVSRSNTRVWTTPAGDLYVQDLRSTNGSMLNGKPIGSDPERVKVGDVIQVGPVPVGVSWWSEAESSRLRRLLPGADDRDRDPLTGLYTPAWLADGGARALAAGFDTGEQRVGLFLTVDRLGALHAQHGAEVADTAFQNVSRAVLARLPSPGVAVRVGYGEILALVAQGGEGGAHDLGTELVEWAATHRWDPKGVEVELSGSVVPRPVDGSLDSWVASGRKAVAEGRTSSGRSRVYSARS